MLRAANTTDEVGSALVSPPARADVGLMSKYLIRVAEVILDVFSVIQTQNSVMRGKEKSSII